MLQTFLEQESGGSYGYSKKGPSMIEKIKKAVDFMRNHLLEVRLDIYRNIFYFEVTYKRVLTLTFAGTESYEPLPPV